MFQDQSLATAKLVAGSNPVFSTQPSASFQHMALRTGTLNSLRGDQGLMDDLDHIIVIIEVLAHSIRTKGAQNYVVHTVNLVISI
jgi:hypothetical protein